MKKILMLLVGVAALLMAELVFAEEFSDRENDNNLTTFCDGMEEEIQQENADGFVSSESGSEKIREYIQDGIIYTRYLEITGITYSFYDMVTGYTEELLSKEEIVIPKMVSYLGGWVTVDGLESECFKGLHNIKTLSVEGERVKIAPDIFDSWDGITIKCPAFSDTWKFAKDYNINQDNSTYQALKGIRIDDIWYQYNESGQYFSAWIDYMGNTCYPRDIIFKKDIYGYPVRELRISPEYKKESDYDLKMMDIRSITIPDSILHINAGTFSSELCWVKDTGYENLTTVIFEPGTESLELGSNLFNDCKKLTDIRFSSRIKKLPDYTFILCPALKRLELPVGMTEIGIAAFQGAGNLEALHIPSTVTEIADDAMNGLTKLTVFGEEASYAQVYAMKHKIDFAVLADDEKMPEIVLGQASIDNSSVKQRENILSVSLEKKVNNADGYRFILSEDPKCTESNHYIQVKNTKTQAVTFSMSKLKGGTYYIASRAWKIANGKKVYGLWSDVKKIKVSDKSLKKAKAPVIKSVKVKGTTVTVTLSASSFAKGSECYLGTAKNSYRPVNLKYSKKNVKTKTVTFKNIRKGTYYIGSRSYTYYPGNAKNYSSWSNMKKIIVK